MHQPSTNDRCARELWLRAQYDASWQRALDGCAVSITLWEHCCTRLIEHTWAGWGTPIALTEGESYLLKGDWRIDCHGRHPQGWVAVCIEAPDGTIIHPAMLDAWVMPTMNTDDAPTFPT